MAEQPHDPLLPGWMPGTLSVNTYDAGGVVDPTTGVVFHPVATYDATGGRYWWTLTTDGGLHLSAETYAMLCRGVVKEDGALLLGETLYHLVPRESEAVLVAVR